MSSLSAIFFDLDGTLVDSSIGIHNGFTYTFDQLGVPSPDAKTIRGFMGPRLETSFASCLPVDQVETAIHMTKGGVVADDKAQVINNDGKVVDGLYAAGEVVDTSGAYSASVIFGRISGEEAAKHILNK